MPIIPSVESTIRIPTISYRFLAPDGFDDERQGRLRYLTGGSGPHAAIERREPTGRLVLSIV